MQRLFVWAIGLFVVAVLVIGGGAYLFSGNRGASASATAEAPRHYVIGVSPNYSPAVRQTVYRSIIDFIARDMPTGSSFTVLDAWNMREVAQGEVPMHRGYDPIGNGQRHSPNRLTLFERQRDLIRRFVMTPQGEATTLPAASIDPARFLVDVGQYYLRPRTQVILIGNPIYHDERAPELSFRDGFFPSDGHIRASSQATIFGCAGHENLLQNVAVHFAFGEEPQWFDSRHDAAVHRFWSLYVAGLSGTLATFHRDPAVAFRQAASGRGTADETFALEPEATKVEMVAIRRQQLDRTILELLFEDDATIRARYDQVRPLRGRSGTVRVGIAWECQSCDIDLYVARDRRAPELFYARRRTDAGQFYKDFAAQNLVPAPVHGYEYVELENVQDVRAVATGVNFYSGHQQGGVRGTLRVEFDGRVFASSFYIPAESGNEGADRDGERRSSRYWQVRQLGDILPQ